MYGKQYHGQAGTIFILPGDPFTFYCGVVHLTGKLRSSFSGIL
jgi:hypothetical protein